MTLKNIVDAYIAADTMSGQTLPYDLALALVNVKKQTRDEAAFYIEKEHELILRYAALDDDGNIRMTANNTFIFKDMSKAAEYDRARSELGNTPLGRGILDAPIRVKAPAEIKPQFIEALEGFIEFM
ncbi:MAG: hypothetical protein FWG36_02060 [Oscillospiraceae bacterium]|nr:hypothetical protein [Oscillospiraceae bacterium]